MIPSFIINIIIVIVVNILHVRIVNIKNAHDKEFATSLNLSKAEFRL